MLGGKAVGQSVPQVLAGSQLEPDSADGEPRALCGGWGRDLGWKHEDSRALAASRGSCGGW